MVAHDAHCRVNLELSLRPGGCSCFPLSPSNSGRIGPVQDRVFPKAKTVEAVGRRTRFMHLLAVGEAEEALLYIQRNLANCISVLKCSRVRKISSV